MIHMMQVAQLVPAQVLQQGQGQQDGTPVEADTAAVTATAAAPAAALVPDSDPGDGEAALTGEPLQIGGQQLFCLPAAPVAQQQGGIFRRGSGIERSSSSRTRASRRLLPARSKSGGSVQEAAWRRPLDSGPSAMICRAVPRRGRRSFSGKTSGAGAGQAGR